MPKIINDYREVYSIFNNDIPEKLKSKKRYGKVRISQALVLAPGAIKTVFKDFYLEHVETEESLKLYVLYFYSKHFKKCNDMSNPPMYSILFHKVFKDTGGYDIIVFSVKKSVIQ